MRRVWVWKGRSCWHRVARCWAEPSVIHEAAEGFAWAPPLVHMPPRGHPVAPTTSVTSSWKSTSVWKSSKTSLARPVHFENPCASSPNSALRSPAEFLGSHSMCGWHQGPWECNICHLSTVTKNAKKARATPRTWSTEALAGLQSISYPSASHSHGSLEVPTPALYAIPDPSLKFRRKQTGWN